MFFGKKEDKKRLPDLPLPRGPVGGTVMNSPFENNVESFLPSFPDSPDHNRFSQAAIKDAVSDEGNEDKDYEGREKTVEMEEWKPSSFKTEGSKMRVVEGNTESEQENNWREEGGRSVKEDEDEEEEEMEQEEMEKPSFVQKRYRPINEYRQQTEDIFVKIDKFHSARKSLHEIRSKLEEMNDLIKRIREVKMREEQELASWEKDMAQIKSRIQNVTENIFEKID